MGMSLCESGNALKIVYVRYGKMAEMDNQLTVVTDTDVFVLHGRPCELSAFSFIPAKLRNVPPEKTYFNSAKKNYYPWSRYDRQFAQAENYNNKIHRDDREHARSRGLTVYDEEIQKVVPTLSSSVYGHRLSSRLDHPDRKHARVAHVKSEFYRRNGVPLSADLKL